MAKPDTRCEEFKAAESWWTRCRDVFEGADAVKAKGTEYLPAIGAGLEGGISYEDYAKRAEFYPAFARTVVALAGLALNKAPSVKVPKDIEDDLKDVTRDGVSLEQFALDVVEENLKVGRMFLWVDMPPIEEEPDAPERPEAARPYWIVVKPENVINWRAERRGGDRVLTLVVIREVKDEVDPSDVFQTVAIEQRRALILDEEAGYRVEVWRKAEKQEGAKPDEEEDWVLYEEVVPGKREEPLTFIPGTFCNARSITPDVEKPPLLDLADLNLGHYRSMADIKHGLHLTALPTPYVTGIGDDDGGPFPLGSGTLLTLPQGATAGMLEFTGSGLAAYRTDEQETRKMMASIGARMLEDVTGGAETATAVLMRHSGEHASLKTVVGTVSQALSLLARYHGFWVGLKGEVPSDVDATITLNPDFFDQPVTMEEVNTALLLAQDGRLSDRTLYDLVARAKLTRAEVTFEEELEELKADEKRNPPPPEPVIDPTLLANLPPEPEALEGDGEE